MDERQEQAVNEAAQKFTDALVESYRAVSDRAVSGREQNAELAQRFFNGVISNLYAETEKNRRTSRDLAEQGRRGQEATRTLTQESIGAYADFLNSVFSHYRQGTEEVAERNVRQAEASIQQAQAGAQAAAEASARAGGSAGDVSSETAEAEPVAAEPAEAEPAAAEPAAEESVAAEPAPSQTAAPETTAPEVTTPEPAAAEPTEARAEELPVEGYDSMNVRQISERLDDLGAEEIRSLRDYEARNKNRQTLLNRFNQRIQDTGS